jgi:hypothetical protein
MHDQAVSAEGAGTATQNEQLAQTGRHRSRLLRWWAAALAIVSLPFVGLMAGSETAIQGDNYVLHIPIFSWVWTSILHGTSPYWAGWNFAGHNIAGMGQGAIYYPPNVLFGLFGEVAAFRWWTMLHLWIAASGAFLWAWRRWGSYPGAAVAGITYALNGQIILHLVHVNFTIATAWFPWLFLGLDGLIRGGGIRRWLAYVVPLVLIAFAGHPQMLWAALVGTGIVVVGELSRRGVGWMPWARYAGATALALGLSAVQLLPQLLFSRSSERPFLGKGRTLGDAARLSDLFTSLFPHIEGGGAGLPGMSATWRGNFSYHEVGNHVGLAVALLALVAVVARRSDRRVVSLAVLGVVAVLMALGEHTPFAGLVFDTVPLADRFRIWSRYLILANLAVTCLAGLGAATLLEAPRRWRTTVLAGGAVAILAAPAVVAFGDSLVSGGVLVVAILVPALAVAVLVGATHLAERSVHRAALLVIAACAVPAVLFTLAAPWHHEALSPAEADVFFDPGSAVWAPFDDAGGVDRWVSRYSTDRGTATVRDTNRIDGYDPLIQKDFVTTTGAVYYGGVLDDRLWSPGWRADVLRITTLAAPRDTDPSDAAWTITAKVTEDGMSLWHRTPRLPEAYVVGAAALDSFAGIDRRLSDPDADFTGTVYLEADSSAARQVATGRTTPGAAGVVRAGRLDRHGNGSFVVAAERPSMLVVSSKWLDGWTATVNGRVVPVLRANSAVLGIPLESGTNRVELSFTPPGLRTGALVTSASAIGLLFICVVPPLRRRRSRPVAAPSDTPPITSG